MIFLKYEYSLHIPEMEAHILRKLKKEGCVTRNVITIRTLFIKVVNYNVFLYPNLVPYH
jgi:hypothetical protein